MKPAKIPYKSPENSNARAKSTNEREREREREKLHPMSCFEVHAAQHELLTPAGTIIQPQHNSLIFEWNTLINTKTLFNVKHKD